MPEMKPYTRKEMYYNGIATGADVPEKPYNREEMYLNAIDKEVNRIRAEIGDVEAILRRYNSGEGV